MKLHQPPFSIRPKGFNTVDVAFCIGKLIIAVVNSIMLFITEVYQAIISSPLVRMDDAFERNFTSNNGLQRGFGTIGIISV